MKNLKLKHLLSVFCFVLLATTLGACKSANVVPPTTIETNTTKTTKEVVRDSTFNVPKDSSYYKAYLECINGKVVISQKSKIDTKKGNHLQPPKVTIKDNMLQVDCEAEAQKLFVQWKDTYTLEHQDKTIKIPYPVEKQLTWFQSTEIICGRIFLGLIGLFIIVVILRLTKVIKV